MLTYLKNRSYYEDFYDRITVMQCLSSEELVNDSFRIIEKTTPDRELQERATAWYVEYSKLYFTLVELLAVGRRYYREAEIDKLMKQDEQKDKRLADAHLVKMPFCNNCGRNMAVINKYFLSREGKSRDNQDIILIVECKPCSNRLTYWEDGTEWEGADFCCDKCQAEMLVSHKESASKLVSTYTCTKCDHSYSETLKFGARRAEQETVDTIYELDRKRFCIDDDTVQRLEEKLHHLGRLSKPYADATERTENADIYDAVKNIEQLKIAQLIETLRPVLEKAHYTEFKLGEPQLGQEVVIEFSCLDSKAEREENKSKNDLRKAIAKTLEATNWRLMSDGVHYRLGYMTGKLKAYEGEDTLKKLVEQRIKNGTLKPNPEEIRASAQYDFEKLDKVELIRIYAEGERLQSHLDPVGEGVKMKDMKLSFSGMLHSNLRVIIPARKDDASVPEFIWNYDFKMESK